MKASLPVSRPRPPSLIRIASLDDHSIVRAVIRTIAEDAPDMELAWSARNIAEAHAKMAVEVPHLLLVDVTLPDGEGYDFIRETLQQHPDLPMLMVSMHEEPSYAKRAYEAGARGYVVKNVSPHDLVKIMQRILRGEYYFNPSVVLPN